MKLYLFISFFTIIMVRLVNAQQVPDTAFSPIKVKLTSSVKSNSTVCIDEAHNNLHTKETGFAAFSRLLTVNGFQVEKVDSEIIHNRILNGCDIFVIANSLHYTNLGNWSLPNPSAFSPKEIDEINEWVSEGGRLLLIADHMPFAGAANALAKSFGFEFSNGFANLAKEGNRPDIFSFENRRLHNHRLLNGEIDYVTTFTGSAFKYPDEAELILSFKKEDVSLEPEIAWQFTDTTITISLDGYAQGAVMNYGIGKIAVFGEAAMFTAQKFTNEQGTFNIGFTAPYAANNQKFTVRLIEYLLVDLN